MHQKARLLFTITFLRVQKRFVQLTNFRQLTKSLFPHAKQLTNERCARIADFWLATNFLDNYVTDKEKFFATMGGTIGVSQMLLDSELHSYQASLDAWSIVFAHSILDAAAFDYLRVIEMVAPLEHIVPTVNKRQIRIEEVKGNTYETLVKHKFGEFIVNLERESLIVKADKIFSFCKPPPKFAPFPTYEYDRNRLAALDQLRHDIVHGDGIRGPLSACDNDVKYMEDTAVFFMCLVNEGYGIKMDVMSLYEWLKQGNELT
jgi:hypothetical protein